MKNLHTCLKFLINMHIGLMVLQMRLQDCAGNGQEGIVAKISPKGMAFLQGVRVNLVN